MKVNLHLMRNDPKFHKGACYAPTLEERERVLKEIIPDIKAKIEAARQQKEQ